MELEKSNVRIVTFVSEDYATSFQIIKHDKKMNICSRYYIIIEQKNLFLTILLQF